MSTRLQNGTVTLEQFEAMAQDDLWRTELVRGRLVREPPAGLEHGHLAARIAFLMARFVYERELSRVYGAETGFVLFADPPTVRAPDVAFLSAARLPTGKDAVGLGRTAPDLAVEVVSPSNTATDILDKAADYLDAGTRLVWIVEPIRRSVTEYRSRKEIRLLDESDVLDGFDVLPGFTLPVAEIFAG